MYPDCTKCLEKEANPNPVPPRQFLQSLKTQHLARHDPNGSQPSMTPARSYPAAATIWTGTIRPASGVCGVVSGAVT